MRLPILFPLLFIFISTSAQKLKPGFDKEEYKELMYVSARTGGGPAYYNQFPAPAHFKMLYQSDSVGMDNLWDLWKDDNNTGVISVRGTTKNSISWLANFYAAMVPATGEIQVTKDYTFRYRLAINPRATVHVGWLLSLGFMSRDILHKVDSLYKTGVKDFLIMGHSQGGAITYLLTSYLYHLQIRGALPADIRFKTYCSAGPKPGNLYYAYDYESLTQNGWAYNVVNSADWVPETPFSIQTLNDFNITNPFINAKAMLKKQGFVKGLALSYIYGRMDGITKRAVKRYSRNLGKRAGAILKKSLPGFQPPVSYSNNMNYARAGHYIVLLADEDYYKQYPDSKTNPFAHHLHKQYLYLLDKLK